MPITTANLKYYKSTATNSLGGAITGTEIIDSTLHNLFDKVTGAESASGKTEYRVFYIKNEHGSLTLEDAVVYIVSNTPSADTVCAIGKIGAVDAVAPTLADEEDSGNALSGVTFEEGISDSNSIAIGNIPAGSFQALVIRRTVSSGAVAKNNDNIVINVRGDTAE